MLKIQKVSGTFVFILFLFILLGVFFLPIVPLALDYLIALNLLFSVLIFLRVLLHKNKERLYSFPALLLITTFFRLGLNISSTRLILSNGDKGLDAAGNIIQGFGQFLVGGDFVVGGIIFIIIALVNFLVIARGSVRIAEVAARFSLDSMPGKQLAISSDYNTGSIGAIGVKKAREALEAESSFLGSMDGAMRFVQGDAIAGLIIVLINSIGGVLTGVMRWDMEFSEAFSNFGVLTVGDGLVSIIPSLILSISAGMIVTKSKSHFVAEDVFGSIEKMLFSSPLTLFIVSLIAILSAFLPIFPQGPFIVLGLLFGSAGLYIKYFSHSYNPSSVDSIKKNEILFQRDQYGAIRRSSSFFIDGDESNVSVVPDLIVEFSHFPLKTSGNWIERFADHYELLSKGYGIELGINFPEVCLLQAEGFSLGEYRILFRRQEIFSDTLIRDQYFICFPPSMLKIFQVPLEQMSEDPLTLFPGAWVCENVKNSSANSLSKLGVKICDSSEFFARQVMGVMLSHVEQLIGISEVQRRLDSLEETEKPLLEEVMGEGKLSLIELSELLKRLVKEWGSIADIKKILEQSARFTLSSAFTESHDKLDLLESQVRKNLSFLNGGNDEHVFVLSEEFSEEFRKSCSWWDGPFNPFSLPADSSRKLLSLSHDLFRPAFERGAVPIVILADEDIRAAVSSFFNEHFSRKIQTKGKKELRNYTIVDVI